jgi:hypothetical protein
MRRLPRKHRAAEDSAQPFAMLRHKSLIIPVFATLTIRTQRIVLAADVEPTCHKEAKWGVGSAEVAKAIKEARPVQGMANKIE